MPAFSTHALSQPTVRSPSAFREARRGRHRPPGRTSTGRLVVRRVRFLLDGIVTHSCGPLRERLGGRGRDRRKDDGMVINARLAMLATIATALPLWPACEEPVQVAAPPPPEVYVSDVVQKDVPTYVELTGQAVGYQDVEIRARV